MVGGARAGATVHGRRSTSIPGISPIRTDTGTPVKSIAQPSAAPAVSGMRIPRCNGRMRWPDYAGPSLDQLGYGADVVALHGLREALRHAFSLRTARWGWSAA